MCISIYTHQLCLAMKVNGVAVAIMFEMRESMKHCCCCSCGSRRNDWMFYQIHGYKVFEISDVEKAGDWKPPR